MKLKTVTYADIAGQDIYEMIETIKGEAHRQGWTNKDLAAHSGVSPNTLSKWFCHEAIRPRTMTLAKVARVLRLRLTLLRANR